MAVGDDEIGKAGCFRIVEMQSVNLDVCDMVYHYARHSLLNVEEDDFRDVARYVHDKVLNVYVWPAFLCEFGTGVGDVVQLSCRNQIVA